MSSSSATATATTAATASPAAKRSQRKICQFSLNGGCRDYAACPNEHPVNPEGAWETYAAMEKKSLNLCGFHPGCTRPACSFLHVDTLPRLVPEPASARAPRAEPKARAAPGKTPARPAGPQARASRAAAEPAAGRGPRAADVGRGRKGPARKEPDARKEPEALCVLHRIRGKVNALERARLAYAMLASEIKSADARDRAETAARMQEEILASLLAFGATLDAHLLDLGATPEPEEDSPGETPSSDEDDAVSA